MKILRSKKRFFCQQLKSIYKYDTEDIKIFKKKKLENFDEKITSKVPKPLISEILKYKIKIKEHFKISNHLLDHLYFIEKDLVNLPKKKNKKKINLDNSLLSIELLNISKTIYSWIDNKKFFLFSDIKIIQLMDVLLSISADFAIEVDSFNFNKKYSKACQEASEFLFFVYNKKTGDNCFNLDHFWQIDKLLLFFYESNYYLTDSDREIIIDISDKITVHMLKKSLEFNLFDLKFSSKNNFSKNIKDLIKKDKTFLENSQLNLGVEIKTLSNSLINNLNK